MRHFLDVDDLSPTELGAVLEGAEDEPAPVLAGRGVGLLFERPSNRTRGSIEMAVVQLGGHPVSLRGDEVGLDSRETVEDVARTLSCYSALIGARVAAHATLLRMASAAKVPVVNLLSDAAHPCQALADLLTLRQRLGGLEGCAVAYVGDFNNTARSLSLAAGMAGVELRVASPPGYGPSSADHERLAAVGAKVAFGHEPRAAVAGADAVYTDVWASMGQEEEAPARRQAFAGYTVDEALMGDAAPHAVFLHCLPAHRGEEVSGAVIDGPRSAVWHQAENRLHAQRSLLAWLLAEVSP